MSNFMKLDFVSLTFIGTKKFEDIHECHVTINKALNNIYQY